MNEFISFFKDRLADFSLQQRRWVGAGVACIAGLTVLVGFFQSTPGPEAYVRAEEAVAKWQANGDEISYLAMKKALKKVPNLERKYNTVIAQSLFHRDRLNDALTLAHASIQHIEEEAPFHAAYGKTTLLIEQGSFQDALERSVGLKENMLQQCDLQQQVGHHPAGGVFLYVHNLLRIACLQKELNNKPGEKAAWDELERFLGSKEDLSQLVYHQFQDNGLDLSNYINDRRKQL